jgi:hypothetical protein
VDRAVSRDDAIEGQLADGADGRGPGFGVAIADVGQEADDDVAGGYGTFGWAEDYDVAGGVGAAVKLDVQVARGVLDDWDLSKVMVGSSRV